MNAITKRLPSFWTVQLAGWSTYLIVIYVTFLPMLPAEGGRLKLLQVKALRTVIGFAVSSVARLLYRRFPGCSSYTFIATVALVTSAVGGVAWALLEIGARWLFYPSQMVIATALQSLPRTALDYSVTMVTWSALYFGVKHWAEWQADRERALRSEALANAAKLEALQYQVQPHFLFNALNSIRASVDEDPQRAKRMVTELAEFLRHSLVTGDRATVSLGEEIEALQCYLAIEQARFEERLQVRFEIEAAAQNCRVPTLLLHPLVENAVKHGFRGTSSPLRIIVSARVADGQLHVEVSNTGRWQENRSAFDSTGTGLRNVRARVDHAFGEHARFEIVHEANTVRAILQIPATTDEQAASHAAD